MTQVGRKNEHISMFSLPLVWGVEEEASVFLVTDNVFFLTQLHTLPYVDMFGRTNRNEKEWECHVVTGFEI